MAFFGLRKVGGDVDLIFLGDIQRSALGERHGMEIQYHSWEIHGKLHGFDGTDAAIDFFSDPFRFGYCHGVKFVSLRQLRKYKTSRRVIGRDDRDVKLISQFLEESRGSDQ